MVVLQALTYGSLLSKPSDPQFFFPLASPLVGSENHTQKGRFLLFPCRGCSTGSRGTGVRMAAEDALCSSADRSEASSADQGRPAGASCEPHPSFSETPSGGSDVT
jgi:hypothetical protein